MGQQKVKKSAELEAYEGAAKKEKREKSKKPKPVAEKKDTALERRIAGKKDLRLIVRIAGKDLDGSLPIPLALRGVKGINHRAGGAIALAFEKKENVSVNSLLGEIKEGQDKILEEIVMNPVSNGIPNWMVNHQREYETGKDVHLVMNELDFALRTELSRLAEIKSYRGLRLRYGLPVRGQRTKSTHRGKGGVVGVTKKDAKAATAAAAKSAPAEKKKEGKKK